MSGWRVLVQEVAATPQPVALPGRDHDARFAVDLGLIEPCGRRRAAGSSHPILYRATEAGRLFAAGKVRAEGRKTGRPGRPELRLAATWLRALPEVTPSQWGGL